MLAKLEMILEGEEIDYRNSSNLQGVLMERIDTEYAEILHEQRLNPYSQYLIKNENQYTSNTNIKVTHSENVCNQADKVYELTKIKKS